ncbi:MAG: phenylacetate--CoA ligase [Oscillospiraceae bacterium]|jgi:phenylacetate-CoA ligase|nr:phenylacetate--CoA ligase [Oscillospiraceae bacterium]
MYFQKEIETMQRGELEALQLARLKSTVKNACESVPFYRERFALAGVKPADIKALSDLRKFPFLNKDDFKNNYPSGLFARPMSEIKRIHASSGTTGKPTVVGYTGNDLNSWSDMVARFIAAVGITEDDVAQISFGYGLFTGALGLHYGLEKLGCAVIPMSSGNTEKQLMMMEDMGVTVLVATPSYALYLSEVCREKGIRQRLKLRVGLFGAEGCTAEMREKIEQNFGIIATDNYGMSELIGPGVSGECIERNGLHIAEDHFIAEIIDPDTLEVLPEGETGELVVTSLTKEALPVIRYRTRDITRLTYEKCKCGRTHARMAKVVGRSDDMLIIKGVNVFPSQIESVLMGVAQISPHYHITVGKNGLMDNLEVAVELTDASLLESFAELEALQQGIVQKLASVLGISAEVRLVEPNSLERFTGKAKRVTDLRKQG